MRIFMISMLLLTCGCSSAGSDKPLFSLGVKEVFNDPRVINLARAAGRGNIAKIDKLVKSGVDVNFVGVGGFTPLYWALKKSNLKGFERLLELGADAELPWVDGGSVLHYSASDYDLEFLKLCIENGADIEASDVKTGGKPIHFAVSGKS